MLKNYLSQTVDLTAKYVENVGNVAENTAERTILTKNKRASYPQLLIKFWFIEGKKRNIVCRQKFSLLAFSFIPLARYTVYISLPFNSRDIMQ